MEQRLAFDQVADVYKTARPGYPEALVEDVVACAELKQNDKVLEIGCGTGQATKSFAAGGRRKRSIQPKSRATPPALAAARGRQSRRARPSPAPRDADDKPALTGS